MSALDRVMLLGAGLLAAYQVAVGIEGLVPFALISLTIAFGALLLAGVLLLILGFEALQSPVVVIASTIIPLSLSLGLIAAYLPAYRHAYLAFVGLGFLLIMATRWRPVSPRIATAVLATVHAAAGLIICLLPVCLALDGRASGAFAFVGLGGALIGVGGLLLSFLKAGRPILSQEKILSLFPGLLFTTTAAFVAGFVFR